MIDDVFPELTRSFGSLVAIASDTWEGTTQARPLSSSSSTSSPTRKRNKKKTIVFSKRVQVLEIPSAQSLTNRERKALWYPDPSDGRKSKLRMILCGMDDILRDDEYDDDHYHRNSNDDGSRYDNGGGMYDERDEGGDYGGESGYSKMYESRRFPVAAVLAEQNNQRHSGTHDDEFIAKIYRQCSTDSVMRAQMRALQDQAEARRCSGTTAEAIEAVVYPMNRTRSRMKKMFRPKWMMLDPPRSFREPLDGDDSFSTGASYSTGASASASTVTWGTR
jgi:hypothetical protein